MNTRKIAAAAGFATGAALAFAPFASADTTDVINFGSIVSSEIASENSIFSLDAELAGVPAADYPISAAGFDTISPADLAQYAPQLTTASEASQVTSLESLLYGANPIEAGISSDSGAFNVFNGALTEFYDVYNTELYSIANPGDTIPAADLIGSSSTISAALASTDPAEYFAKLGVGDLQAYFGDFGTSTTASTAASTTDISSTVSAEISSLNSMFSTDASLFGVGNDVVTNPGSFDTISLADLTNADGSATPFESFLYGLDPSANVSSDPGAYDLFNGALAKFDDAINFGVYALENGGAAIPAADFSTDLFGVSTALTTELTGATASQAITDLLGNATSDLLGYFDIGSVASLF